MIQFVVSTRCGTTVCAWNQWRQLRADDMFFRHSENIFCEGGNCKFCGVVPLTGFYILVRLTVTWNPGSDFVAYCKFVTFIRKKTCELVMENRNGFLYHDMMSSSEPIKIKWAFCSKTYGPNLGIEKQQGHFVRKQPVGSGLGGLKKSKGQCCMMMRDLYWSRVNHERWCLMDIGGCKSCWKQRGSL